MIIKELIKKLQEYKNQDLKVLITIGNEENDTISTGDFDLFNADETYDYMEIFVNENTCKRQL